VVVATFEGGTAVREGIAHPVVYTLSEIGNLLAVCTPALCVGVAALVLAVRGPLPVWLRIFSMISGTCGILAPFFFPYFIFVLWTLVTGAVVASRRRGSVTILTQPAPSLV